MSARLCLSAVIVLLLATALLPAAPARAECTFPAHLYMSPFCTTSQTIPMMTTSKRVCFAQLLTPISSPVMGRRSMPIGVNFSRSEPD